MRLEGMNHSEFLRCRSCRGRVVRLCEALFMMREAGIQSTRDEPEEEIHREGGGDVASEDVMDEQAELDPHQPQADIKHACAAQVPHAAVERVQGEYGNEKQQAEWQPADLQQEV